MLISLNASVLIIIQFSPDDKKLSGVLKKMALTDIKGVEEVNIFINDGGVIHIPTPKSMLHSFTI